MDTMIFNQLATTLNSIVKQATGAQAKTATNTAEFVSQATTALRTGYDPLNTAVSQVLGKTIFSIRPYYRKFGGLKVDNQRFGNHTRKLNIADKDWQQDDRILLVDGQHPDMFAVNKPNVLQTNFYGTNVYSRSYTVYKDQLDCAFTTPDEFYRFIAQVTQNVSDQIEQAHETTARALVSSVIGSRLAVANSPSVIHLLSEYNTATGQTTPLTAADIYKAENFAGFVRWMYARIKTVSDIMTERSQLYHTNVTGKAISRHTPKDRQRLYMYAPIFNQIASSVLSTTYNDKYLDIGDYEAVNFWQSISTPDAIDITAGYLGADGAIATETVQQNNIIGVLMDEEAAIYTTVNEWSQATPFEARGGYTNYWYHFSDRLLQDDTENSVVFVLD